MNKFKRYFDAINFLEGLSNLPLKGDYVIDSQNPGMHLKRMRYFLDLIGSPDKDMKYIHVTGTAGKGSVTNMLHEVIHASGERVGSFTSPFVTTSIEKIKVDDLYISPSEFAEIVEYLKPYIDTAYISGPYGRPSYFELFLAIAFIYFKRQCCKWVVLEVGLGGRYDATNIIKDAVVTTITNIDYDHTEILGNTLEKIAYDKAGIIKSGSVFFTAEQRPPLLKIFKNVCIENDVEMLVIPKQQSYNQYNTNLVMMIVKYIGIKNEDIIQGIKNAKLQCRFEIIQNKPLVILDGAHNRAKIKSTIDNLNNLKYEKLHLVIGIADNKDHLPILKQVVPLADSIVFTRFQIKDRKCAHPKELYIKSKRYIKRRVEVCICLDSRIALHKAIKQASSHDVVLVVGSFFLAGELRKKWFSEESVLENRKSFW